MHRAFTGARASTERVVYPTRLARPSCLTKRGASVMPMISRRSLIRRGDLCKAAEFKDGNGEPVPATTPEV